MRQWVTLLLLAGMALPAMAAKVLSVAEMEQLLAANQGNADKQVAQQLKGVELAERVSPARMARWEKNFSGSKTREALMSLADSAAFLNPPEEDVIPDPMPDAATRTKIFALAVDFTKTTFTRLPNFYAKRITTHFENEPVMEQPTPWGNREILVAGSESMPMHIKGTYSETVAYRQGSEVHEKAGKGSKPDPSNAGLTTNGEFGPILGIVLGDAIRTQSVTWSHWEQGQSGPIAVFHYSIPQDRSHYTAWIPNGMGRETLHPGYHGEIAIDPATGNVMRTSAVIDMAPPHQAIAMAMLVEYAPVTIGSRTYICPVHGVAYSKVPLTDPRVVTHNSIEMMNTQMNDVVFTQYHQFGSEIHIVSEGSPQTGGSLP